MQKRSFVVLFLLVALSSGLLAGPHPCHARQGEGRDRPSSSASCHGTESREETRDGASAQASVPAQDQDHDPADCCSTSCRYACQMTATTEACPAAFTIAAVAQVAVEAPGHDLPLFAHPIDHVPLV